MTIGQWFNEGASARSDAGNREDCPYPDGEARSEWLSGFDEAATFENKSVADDAGRAERLAANANRRTG